MPRVLLTYRSTFFDAAFDGRSPRADNDAADMRQNDHEASWSFVKWLYTAKTEGHEAVKLMEALKKGDKFNSSAFCGSLMRNLIQKHWVDILQSRLPERLINNSPPALTSVNLEVTITTWMLPSGWTAAEAVPLRISFVQNPQRINTNTELSADSCTAAVVLCC